MTWHTHNEGRGCPGCLEATRNCAPRWLVRAADWIAARPFLVECAAALAAFVLMLAAQGVR